MGVDEFRNELAWIKDSFDSDLIPDKEIFEKMCIDAQRRNLSNLTTVAIDRPPLNLIGLKRLLWPVFITVTALGCFIAILVGFLYRSLSDEIRTSEQSAITSLKLHNSSILNVNDSSLSAFILDSSSNTSSFSPNPTKLVDNHIESENMADQPILKESHIDNSNNDNKNNDSNNEVTKPLYYISTSDGILSHFFQLQHLWSITHHLNRSVIPVSFHSPNHYQDVEWINLCDIFELPSDIDCTGRVSDEIILSSKNSENSTASQLIEINQHHLSTKTGSVDGAMMPTTHILPNVITKSHKCTMLGVYSWAMDPHLYSLPAGQQAERKFDFFRGDCVAGYVDERSGYSKFKRNPSVFPMIKFKEKYVRIINLAKVALGLNDYDHFTVVHWIDEETGRRGKECDEKDKDKDNIQRENNGQLNGNGNNNCVTHYDFIQNIHKALDGHDKGKLLYVATGEKNASTLSHLSKEGFKIFSDLNISSLNSLEISILELGLMVESTFQIFWGKSIFKNFSELMNSQKILIRKKR